MRPWRSLSLFVGLLLSVPAFGQEELRTVTIDAVGDTMVGSIFPSREAMPPEDGRRIFDHIKDLWANADIVMGNFEGTVSSDAASALALGAHSYRFLMPPESLAIYKDAGFNLLNVANNHAMDAGLAARMATLAALDAAGIQHGGSLDQPSTVVTTANGVKVGFIGCAPHMNCFPLDAAQVGQKIKDLKETEGCSLVFVSMHAGAEGEGALHVPKAHEIYLGADRGDVYAFAHAAINAGADLVVGHGPHVPRGMEVYKGHLIAYSLGNFATYGAFNLKATGSVGLVLEVALAEDGTLKGLRIHSTKQDKGSEAWAQGIAVEPDPSEMARKLIEKLSKDDFQTDISQFYLPVTQPAP